MAEERALTLKDVATRLTVSERTVTRLAEDRELIGYKVGHSWRFEPSAVKAFIEKQQAEMQVSERTMALIDEYMLRLSVEVRPIMRRFLVDIASKHPEMEARLDEEGLKFGSIPDGMVQLVPAIDEEKVKELIAASR